MEKAIATEWLPQISNKTFPHWPKYREGFSAINYKTADVVRVIKKGDKIQLVMNNKMVVRMYKSAFVEGSWEACKELLYEICI